MNCRSLSAPIKKTIFSVFLLAAFLFGSFAVAQEDGDNGGGSSSGSGGGQLRLEAVRCLTWWYHDAIGYHPAILFTMENVSGEDLSGLMIKVQARFTNMSTGNVNVARKELQCELKPNKQVNVRLWAPTAYELPIDQNQWPKMECKVMCRVGEGGDETTQNLILTKVNPITMSDMAAEHDLIQQPFVKVPKRNKTPVAGEKPLVAMAGSLKGKDGGRSGESISDFLKSQFIPGLGDDFYLFEKKYGRP
ncbi:MAG: hypothetical protein K2Z81_15735, partial [Cyanobacteria bacterium]|nr:hypothetical protein [Cyanobacteriota bacterium]